MNQKVLKYCQSYMKLSSDEMSAEYYINTICQSRQLEESLEIADTLKVLSAINLNPPPRKPRQNYDESITVNLKRSKDMIKRAMEVSARLGADCGVEVRYKA